MILCALDDVIARVFLHFFRKIAYEEVMKIEAYLVRLCAVLLLLVIPDFCRPFANDSLEVN